MAPPRGSFVWSSSGRLDSRCSDLITTPPRLFRLRRSRSRDTGRRFLCVGTRVDEQVPIVRIVDVSGTHRDRKAVLRTTASARPPPLRQGPGWRPHGAEPYGGGASLCSDLRILVAQLRPMVDCWRRDTRWSGQAILMSSGHDPALCAVTRQRCGGTCCWVGGPESRKRKVGRAAGDEKKVTVCVPTTTACVTVGTQTVIN